MSARFGAFEFDGIELGGRAQSGLDWENPDPREWAQAFFRTGAVPRPMLASEQRESVGSALGLRFRAASVPAVRAQGGGRF